MTVSRLEHELSGQNELTRYAAFLSMWPSGEEAMDIRFQALRKDIGDLGQKLEYSTYKAAGAKSLSKPRFRSLSKYRIFRRLGNEEGRKKYFDEMTPEDVNLRMRAFSSELVARSKGKTRKRNGPKRR